MPTPFDTAALSLHATLLPQAGATISYQRGDDSQTVDAVLGQTQFMADTFDGGITRYHSRDFLITTADLPYGLPEKGDSIIVDNRQYKVMPPDGGEDFWRWSDAYGNVVRIHTKFIGLIGGAFSDAFSCAFDSVECQ